MAGLAHCALFGKLPWAADYVRVHHVHPAGLALDAWLQASQQPLAQAGAAWPAVPLRFVFADREGGGAVTGVLAPSRDRARRRFPVALFAALPAAPLAARFADVPTRLTPFYAAAERALAELAEGDRAATVRAVERLRAPALDDLAARADHAALPSAHALAHALFEDEAPAARLLAVATDLARAARDARERPAAQARVLDLPCRAPGHVAAWLALIAPLVDARAAPPSLFWSEAPGACRALLALGPPPASLLLWLADPRRRAARLLVPREAHDDPLAARLAAALPPAAHQLSADCFFDQLAARLVVALAQ